MLKSIETYVMIKQEIFPVFEDIRWCKVKMSESGKVKKWLKVNHLMTTIGSEAGILWVVTIFGIFHLAEITNSDLSYGKSLFGINCAKIFPRSCSSMLDFHRESLVTFLKLLMSLTSDLRYHDWRESELTFGLKVNWQ